MSIFSILGGKSLGKRKEAICEEAKQFVQVHYVREKSEGRYKFNKLTIKDDPERTDCEQWYNAHGNPTDFGEIVSIYLEEYKISKEDICSEYKINSDLFNFNNSSTYSIMKWEAVAICFGLDLNISQTRALLKTVGYALTNSFETDLIIRFCFENDIYKLSDINYILEKLQSKKLSELGN